jgi:hypothetical protein
MTTQGLGVFEMGLIACGLYGFTDDGDAEIAEGVRYIDPRTGDYAVRDTEILRTTSTRQRVLNLVVNAYGSSMSVRGTLMPQAHDANTQTFVEREVRAALSPLVDEATIELRSVVATTGAQGIAGRLGVSVEYTDLVTGDDETVSV